MSDVPSDEIFDWKRTPSWSELGAHPSEYIIEGEIHVLPPLSSGLRWSRLPDDELSWLAIEIQDDIPIDGHRISAERWWDTVGDGLMLSAIHAGAQDTSVRFFSWGLLFEVAFRTDADVDDYRTNPALASALDQRGELHVTISAGRGGGGAGSRSPRRPRPRIGSGAAELPIPTEREREWLQEELIPLSSLIAV
jgi:hypothetical protein